MIYRLLVARVSAAYQAITTASIQCSRADRAQKIGTQTFSVKHKRDEIQSSSAPRRELDIWLPVLLFCAATVKLAF